MTILTTLSNQLGQLLLAKHWSIATAESCTGGGVSQAITEISGSSQWFTCGFVTYSNQAKHKLLNVPKELLIEYGAVSEEAVHAMLKGTQKKSKAEVVIAISGIAGPAGGTPEKPVGLIVIGTAVHTKHHVQSYHFSGNRKKNRDLAIRRSLENTIDLLRNTQ